jgi:hypothetical protein
MIALRSSNETTWPWSSGDDSEKVFEAAYPAVYRHMCSHKSALLARKNNVRFWWELSSFGRANFFL